jgi:hypothetical protein
MAQESMPPYKPPLAPFFGDLGKELEQLYIFFGRKLPQQIYRESRHQFVGAPMF